MIRFVGRGSFGAVWAAWHNHLNEVHALKVLDRNQPEDIADFLHEARSAWALALPGVLVPFGLFRDEEDSVIAMPLVHGERIDDWLAAQPAGSRAEAAEQVFARLFQRLAELHARGLSHGDIKPGNVMVRPDGRVVLLDLGFSRWARPPSGGLPQSVSGGLSLPYAAPERLVGGAASPASDVYAVGALIQHCDTAGSAALHDIGSQLRARAPKKRPSPAECCAALGVAPLRILQPHAAIPRAVEAELLDFTRRQAPIGVLVGEVGSGRSTVLSRVEDTLHSENVLVLQARCYRNDRTPLKLLGLLTEALARARVNTPAELLPLLSEELGALFPQLLLWLPRQPQPVTHEATYQRQVAVARLLWRWLQAEAAGRPIALLVDDLHWADVDSIRVISSWFSDGGASLTLLATTTDAALLDAQLEPLREVGFSPQTFALAPLAADQADALLSSLIGAPSSPGAADPAAGNPTLILDLAYARVRGLDAVSPTGWRLESTSASQVELLRTLAVARRPADADEVPRLLEEIALKWEDLEALHSLRLLEVVGTAPHTSVALSHTRLADRLLAELSERSLIRIHQRWLSLIPADAAPGKRVVHLEATGQIDEAAAAAAAAAREAMRRLAFHDAARWLSSTQQLLQRAEEVDTEALQWAREAQGEALFLAGLTGAAGEAYARAVQSCPEPARQARLARRAAQSFLYSGRYEQGMAQIAEELAALGVRRRTSVWQTIWVFVRIALLSLPLPLRPASAARQAHEQRRAELLWVVSRGITNIDAIPGISMALDARRSFVRAGDVRSAAEVSAFLAGSVLFQIPPLRRVSDRILDETLAMTRRTDDTVLAGTVEIWRGTNAVGRGEWAAAQASFECAIEQLPLSKGLHWERGVATGMLAWLHQMHGNYRIQRGIVLPALQDAVARGDLYGRILFEQYASVLDLVSDSPEQVERRTRWIHDFWPYGDYNVPRFFAMMLDTLRLLMCNQPDAALARWDAAQPLLRKAGLHHIPALQIDNATTEARIRLRLGGAGDVARLRALKRQLQRASRRDGPGYAAWLEWALSEPGTDPTAAIEAVAASGMEAGALALQLQSGDASAAALLEARGVVTPSRWAATFFPPLRRSVSR